MSKELVLNRMLEFKKFVITNKRLPKLWETKFLDQEDMRIWFNNICKLPNFQNYVTEINNLLSEYNFALLSDSSKEKEFLNYIMEHKMLPLKNKVYFSNNEDMFSWYNLYRLKHRDFEELVHNNLFEYEDFDLNIVWSNIKDEFLNTIKKLKRIPNHGEAKTSTGIDIRIIYDKLLIVNPIYCEKLLLYIASLKEQKLSIANRIQELKTTTSSLGYIPEFQESRFSDNTDMYTWYMRYKTIIPSLEPELNTLIKENNIKAEFTRGK